MDTKELRSIVVGAAAHVLGADPDAVAASTDLSAFPAFTSFRVLDIVESLERQLDVEVDPNDLVPEKLREIDSLCAMFRVRA